MRIGTYASLALLAACTAGVDGGPGGPGLDAPQGPGPGATADHVRYRGTLATTPTVPFGGMGFCDYSVTLRNVTFDIVLSDTTSLTSMLIEDTMTEAALNGCPHAPAAPNRQQFSHNSSRPVTGTSDGTFTPILSGVPTNSPATATTSFVSLQRDGTLQVSAQWKRTDQGPPLAWTVTTAAPVTLQATTCVLNDLLCLGGSQGVVYSCQDGMRMLPVRLCDAGCNTAQTACN